MTGQRLFGGGTTGYTRLALTTDTPAFGAGCSGTRTVSGLIPGLGHSGNAVPSRNAAMSALIVLPMFRAPTTAESRSHKSGGSGRKKRPAFLSRWRSALRSVGTCQSWPVAIHRVHHPRKIGRVDIHHKTSRCVLSTVPRQPRSN